MWYVAQNRCFSVVATVLIVSLIITLVCMEFNAIRLRDQFPDAVGPGRRWMLVVNSQHRPADSQTAPDAQCLSFPYHCRDQESFQETKRESLTSGGLQFPWVV